MRSMNPAGVSRTCIAILLACAALPAQSPSGQFESAVAAGVNDVLAKSAIAGVSVAIGRSREVVFARGYGMADLESRRPLDVDAVMDMGSIGKQFTAAAVLKLVDAGRIDLDAPLSRYLPAWKDASRHTTVRQLLNHTSGIEDPPVSEEKPEPRFLEPAGSGQLLAFIQTASFPFAARETWLYSNAGYQLLGLMLEEVHGKPYALVIEESIRAPLGLTSLTWCDKNKPIAKRTRDYYMRLGKPAPIPPIDVSWFGGAGSLCATASDLVRWEQALSNNRVLSPARRAAMHQPTTLQAGNATTTVDYGFGRAFGTFGGHRKIAHPGTGAGISASLAHYPDDDLIVAVMVNTNGPGIPHARDLEARIASTLLAVKSPAIQDVLVTPDDARRWAGTYRGSFNAGPMTFTSCEAGGLCAALGNKRARLRHRGDGVFIGPLGPRSELRFTPAGRRAAWVVETLHGIHDNVLRRVNERRPR
jgi:CubicO group peptidase (beta-lactamase class C family)